MDTKNDTPSGSNTPQETVTQSPPVISSNSSQNPHQSNTSHAFGKWIIIIVILFCLIGVIIWYLPKFLTRQTPQAPISQNDNQKGVLLVGETIDEDGLAADTKEFQPFIDYLVANLHQYGYTKGTFVGAHSVAELAELVREGQVNIVIDSAFPVYVVDELANTHVIADRWKGRVGTYHSAIFVKQNSSIKTTNDLKGKILAFDSNTSTVGYFLPKAELINEGYTLIQKSKPTDICPSNDICYVFVHGNVYDSVANNIVPAGAESELEIDAYFGDKIKDYRIIHKSPDISRFLVATSGNMDTKQVDAIKNILFTMDQTEQGNKVLKSFANTAKFTPIENNDTAYGAIKNLTSTVENEIIAQ